MFGALPTMVFLRSTTLRESWLRQEETENKMVLSEISIPIILPRCLVQDIDTREDWKRAELMYDVLNKGVF